MSLNIHFINYLNMNLIFKTLPKFTFSTRIRVKDMLGANPVRGFSIEFGKLEQQNPKAINLALGVPFDPTAPHIVQAKLDFVKKTGNPGANGYGDPRGYPALLEALPKYYNETYRTKLTA